MNKDVVIKLGPDLGTRFIRAGAAKAESEYKAEGFEVLKVDQGIILIPGPARTRAIQEAKKYINKAAKKGTYIAETAIRAGISTDEEFKRLVPVYDVMGLATPVVIDNQPRMRVAFQGQAEQSV